MSENERRAKLERTTRETSVHVELNLDGEGAAQISTGVGFLDHMLELLAKHARLDLTCRAEGDLEVGAHHTTEDVGIVLGTAFAEALGEKRGIVRFADARVPMDESLAVAAVDVSGRGGLAYCVQFPASKVGAFDVELVEEFLSAFCKHAGLTLHVDLVRGTNSHHVAEAVFKAVARALKEALRIDPQRSDEVPSTKGVL